MQVRGVLRDPSLGCPSGSLTITSESCNFARMTSFVGSSETAVGGMEELNQIYGALTGRLTVNTLTGANAELHNLKMKTKVELLTGRTETFIVRWGCFCLSDCSPDCPHV